MLVNADEFLYNLLAYRILWIRGRLGGGKTLLAVALAQHLIERHGMRGVVANFPVALRHHEWREPHPDGHPRGVRGSVCIWDEAGLFLDRRAWATNDRGVGALLRKLDSVLLLPSVTPPDLRLSYFSVARDLRLSLPGGESWRYVWQLALPGTRPEAGTFWLMPAPYYGLYDTRYIPVDDAGYMTLWRATIVSMGAGGLLSHVKGEEDAEEVGESEAPLA